MTERAVRRRSQLDEAFDPDLATSELLSREQKTISKGRLRRMRIKSLIIGNSLPSRTKVFTTVQEETDYKLYSITVHNVTIPCAKIFNPALLEKDVTIWNKLALVQKLELEDSEGTLTALPKQFATHLERLESLSITWSRIKTLPVELYREGLKRLHLQRNQVKNLSGIERAVDLANLDASSNLLKELPKTFGQLQNLTDLNISGNAVRELPDNFGCLNKLRVFDCSCNSLTVLPESIRNLINLTCLDVSNNYLTALPEGTSNLPWLEDLRARANQLEFLPHRFGQLTRLISLILRKNKFQEVPPQLAKIGSLLNLNMSDNSIRSFTVAIPSLNSLLLNSNDLEEIGRGLLDCPNLQMLSLEDNKISVIPRAIGRMKSLHVLQLSGNDVTEVPEEVGLLDQLRRLSLSRTKIHRLPDAILTMSSLVKVDISDCPNLSGYLTMAFKAGGLAKIREEMLNESSREEDAKPEVTCSSGPGTSDQARGPLAIQPCRRETLLSPDLPGSATDCGASQQLAESLRGRPDTKELFNLSTIRESQSEEPCLVRNSGTSSAFHSRDWDVTGNEETRATVLMRDRLLLDSGEEASQKQKRQSQV